MEGTDMSLLWTLLSGISLKVLWEKWEGRN